MATEVNIALAGCGICSVAMMFEQLLPGEYSLEEIMDLAVSCKANLDPGTDMKVLGQELCSRYGLLLHMSDHAEDLMKCLQTGGRAIINVGGDREGRTGIFSHGVHYILAVACQANTATILNPSWKKEKFEEPERKWKVIVQYPFCLCSTEVLKEDTANRTPAYYCFKRRTDGAETETRCHMQPLWFYRYGITICMDRSQQHTGTERRTAGRIIVQSYLQKMRYDGRLDLSAAVS